MNAPASLSFRTTPHALPPEGDPDAALWAAAAKLEAAESALNKAIEADDKNPQDQAIRNVIRAALTERRQALATISVLQAHTAEGCLIKANILHDDVLYGRTEHTQAIAAGLVMDLARLAAKA